MGWVFYSILNACFESLKDLLIKRVAGKRLDVYSLTWGLLFYTGLFYLPITLTTTVPEIEQGFWFVLFTNATLFGLSLLLYVKALEIADVSLTIPLVMFTPLFMLLTSPLMVGEVPSMLGLIGILLIVAGSYLLNINRERRGYFAPLKALVDQRGPRLMLLFAFCMSITSNFDKIGLQKSSPYFWMGCLTALLPVLTGVIFTAIRRQTIPNALRASHLIIPAAIANVGMIYCHITAVSIGLVIYVIAIKRTSVIISVVASSLIFKENGLRSRLLGSLVMLFGVILIASSK